MRKMTKLERRRKQWRESKRRSRARLRAYESAMAVERMRPVDVDGVDLSAALRSVEVRESQELVDATLGGFFGDEPDRWVRKVPGFREMSVDLTLLDDDAPRPALLLREKMESGEPVTVTLTRGRKTLVSRPFRVVKVANVGILGNLTETEVELRACNS